jgi:hypothetical protein
MTLLLFLSTDLVQGLSSYCKKKSNKGFEHIATLMEEMMWMRSATSSLVFTHKIAGQSTRTQSC